MKYLIEIIVTLILLIIISIGLYISIKFNTGGPPQPSKECKKYINDIIRDQPSWHLALWFSLPLSLFIIFIYYFILKLHKRDFSYLSFIYAFTLILIIIFVANYFLITMFVQHYIGWWYSSNTNKYPQ